jgi:lipoprotein-releasing system permease protein
MQKPLSLFIALRYIRAKKRQHFVSFISLASVIGIALGVCVLITVLSVMNGFDTQIRSKIFSMAPHITLTDLNNRLSNYPAWTQKIQTLEPNVIGSAPFVQGEGLLKAGTFVAGVGVQGIDPLLENNINDLSKKMVAGKLSALQPSRFGIVLGQGLADNLGVDINDKVILFTPNLTVTPAGVSPRFKRFTVVGIFKVGNNLGGFDQNLAFINLQDASALFMLPPNTISGLNLKVNNLYTAPAIADDISNTYPNLSVSDWTQTYGALFKAIAMEKTMMFLILFLIIAIAAFNLVSGLVMVVNDKQSDIAILRTMGASKGLITRIFILQGMLLGILGTFFGVVSGILLSLNVTEVVNGLQYVLHRQLFQTSVYFLNQLPSELKVSDVITITLSTLVLSFLATLYPARQGAKTHPVEALRYE